MPHFRADVLMRLGGWDPYNVTEDADLGMRLERFGYRTTMFPSSTYEEAPARLGPWLKQRTRWFKGWMQVWLVHMRSPRQLWRDLGWKGFLVFQLLVMGSVLAALVHVPFALWLAWLAVIAPTEPIAGEAATSVTAFAAAALGLGYAMSAVLGVFGLARRRLLGNAWALVATPVYWILLSLAAWRALLQLRSTPYAWEKTEHGLARTSRRFATGPQK